MIKFGGTGRKKQCCEGRRFVPDTIKPVMCTKGICGQVLVDTLDQQVINILFDTPLTLDQHLINI